MPSGRSAIAISLGSLHLVWSHGGSVGRQLSGGFAG
jgi:hypothetical protein